MRPTDAYTISSLTQYIRTVFEADERLADVWVQGEISNFTRASSGHWYFTLKDAGSALKAVMWRSQAARQTFTPNHGDAVLAHGYVSVYEASGQYQLYVDALQPAGRGDLHQRFELLKAKLEAEGLFDAEHKRPLPPLPRKIGVVTSPTAAAFQDVLNVLARRYPLAEVILSPTLVQGDDAPPQIVAALEAIQRADVDVILLVRGGGSLEDLWAFNDERVARAVYASRLPIVTGVGHEIDFTIVDFVSDRRAPTPSAAAETITPYTSDDLAAAVQNYGDRLYTEVLAQIDERRRMLDTEARLLLTHSPQRRIGDARQRLDELGGRATRALAGQLTLRRERLAARQRALTSADPRAILQRGYAIVEADGQRLTAARQTSAGAALDIHLAQGRLRATVNEIEDNA